MQRPTGRLRPATYIHGQSSVDLKKADQCATEFAYLQHLRSVPVHLNTQDGQWWVVDAVKCPVAVAVHLHQHSLFTFHNGHICRFCSAPCTAAVISIEACAVFVYGTATQASTQPSQVRLSCRHVHHKITHACRKALSHIGVGMPEREVGAPSERSCRA